MAAPFRPTASGQELRSSRLQARHSITGPRARPQSGPDILVANLTPNPIPSSSSTPAGPHSVSRKPVSHKANPTPQVLTDQKPAVQNSNEVGIFGKVVPEIGRESHNPDIHPANPPLAAAHYNAQEPQLSHADDQLQSKPLISKIFVSPSQGRPNLRNPEARNLMGVNADDYAQIRVSYEQGNPGGGAFKWPKSFRPRMGKPKTALGMEQSSAPDAEQFTSPDGSRVRLVNTGMKFRTIHHNPSDAPDPSLAPRMYKYQSHNTAPKRPQNRIVYAWPEGATEAVEMRVNVPRKKYPQFRKIQFEEKITDQYAPVKPDDFMAVMKETPQRPLPEETYRRITQGVESAKKLPPQKVQLEDFDIYGSEDIDESDYLISKT
ncbi:hypothetical protein BKA67DRAFT_61087 [Truncatella angustata]|uniref:Uncharacterized protein n=1 Tax=Truncatella angustata TaxID=152316 RepID=A0A9P8UYV1_9PEZI|nr:uncharacterized protein BKA67DRAFT_61087 [Truncatella angustata]KAH6660645.1 hypothetical protein BKA67DRAFT_61087 [Truncatella angustata]